MDKIVADTIQYMQGNTMGAIAVGVILFVVLIKRPKLFLILLLLCIAAAGAMKLFDTVSSVGTLDRDFRSLNEIK